MSDATQGPQDLAGEHEPTRNRVLKVGLANLTLTGEPTPLQFTRTAPDEYFALTVNSASDPAEDTSVYQMGGTVSVTVEGRRVSIDRIELAGTAMAGLDRGELRLTNTEPLVCELRESQERRPGEDVRYTGEFVAEGTLQYTDGLNNAETLGGRSAVEFDGMRIRGQIVDADHILLNITGSGTLLSRAGLGVAPAAVTM